MKIFSTAVLNFNFDTDLSKANRVIWHRCLTSVHDRRRSSVNFRGQDILPEKYVCKNNKVSEFYMILARKIITNTLIFMIFAGKINKIPEFYAYMIFLARKCPNFT